MSTSPSVMKTTVRVAPLSVMRTHSESPVAGSTSATTPNAPLPTAVKLEIEKLAPASASVVYVMPSEPVAVELDTSPIVARVAVSTSVCCVDTTAGAHVEVLASVTGSASRKAVE